MRGPLRLTAPAPGLVAGRTTEAEVRRVLDAQQGWPGVPAARRAVDLADARAESPLETRGRLRLAAAGLAPTALQVEIRSRGRLVGVVDAWYEDAAVAVEFGGRVRYTSPWRDPGRVLWEEKRREDELPRARRPHRPDRRRRPGTVVAGRRAPPRLALAAPAPASRRSTTVTRERGRSRSA